VLLGVVDKIKEEPQCKGCILYHEMLQREIADKNYYRQLALRNAGVIKSDEEVHIDKENWQPVRRPITLTQARRMASEYKKNEAELAKDRDKTDAEKLFEEQLNEAKKEASIQ
jgi:hypothetical protein